MSKKAFSSRNYNYRQQRSQELHHSLQQDLEDELFIDEPVAPATVDRADLTLLTTEMPLSTLGEQHPVFAEYRQSVAA